MAAINKAKIDAAKSFLEKSSLQPHHYNLLGLVGAVYLDDFCRIDDELLDDIEKRVQDKGSVFNTKVNSLKFFGGEQKDPNSFAFTLLERRKLKKPANKAHDACKEYEKASLETQDRTR